MAISIRNPEAVNLARGMAEERGVTITQVVTEALEEKHRNESLRSRQDEDKAFVREIMEISRRCSSLKVLDSCSENEIPGYDEGGDVRWFLILPPFWRFFLVKKNL